MRSDRTNTLIAFLIGCALAAGAVTLSMRITSNHSQTRDTCRQVQTLKGAIGTLIGQDLHSIGKPGSGGYAYFKSHPDELAHTKSVLTKDVASFRPKHCH